MNELSIVVVMSIAAVLWAAASYSVGYREGQREGYARGRSISRHAALSSIQSKNTAVSSVQTGKAAK